MLRLADPDPAAVTARGLAVFPIIRGRKFPHGKGWQTAATLDPQDWHPGDNIGVGCRASNVVVFDLDVDTSRRNGIEHLARLVQSVGEPLPPTLVVRTPSGGRHIYFRARDEFTIGSVSGWASGIDVRGPGCSKGGYVVGPGSVVDHVRYTVVADAPIAPIPEWLARMFTMQAVRRARRQAVST